ncbi:MAG: hypothetical protein GF411_17835 [Candidatus Lokiarchaeota archaeon]|nr:hypothetical protein [Candidatus Lokiarchaeota archaeon]
MDKMFNALAHKIRRKIIVMVGNQGSVTYTDLTKLGLEPGTLYHHLDILVKSEAAILIQGKNKQYSLTDLGEAALSVISQGEDQTSWTIREHNTSGTIPKKIADYVGMKPLTIRIQRDPWRFVIEVILFLSVYGYLASEVALLPFLLFFLEGTFISGITIIAALASWIITYLLVEILSMIILKKREPSRGLFMAIPLAFVPHFLIELLWYIAPASAPFTGWPLTIVLTGIISWSTYILTVAVARAKKVRLSRAAMITLIITNLNLFLLALITGF